MSSSAFTPTQTQITNNVPTNVPVVEAWQSYNLTIGATTTAPTLGTVLVNEARWRRVGDSMEIYYSLRTSTAGTIGSGLYLFPLPSGYTVDSSKMSPAGSGSSGAISIVGPAEVERSGIIYTGAAFLYDSSNICIQVGASGQATTVVGTLYTLDVALKYTFRAVVPIAQWAGSGTTTLATRAVEEYAFSTSSITAAGATQSDDGLYGYGPSGAQFNAIASTTINSRTRLRVRFQTPIQPTDSLALEVFISSLATWSSVANSSLDFCPLTFQNTSAYGMTIETISGSATDVYVSFGNCGRLANASTYANNNGSSWSGVAGSSSFKWRVRKVSSGAQVGYPVSARNIIGDTSGTTVPTGMIGETIAGTAIANPVVLATTSTAISSITLQPGRWALKYNINPTIETGASAGNRTYAYFRIRDSSDTTTIANSVKLIVAKTTANVSGEATAPVSAEVIVDVSTSTTYLLRGIRVDGSGTGIASVYNGGTTESSNFYAVRIA